ncbi:MAG: bifunctional heptose 7-phosphate kinase/heptose 1-phosphate adenyltransferase, partial [Bdellovibrionota bacterium]
SQHGLEPRVEKQVLSKISELLRSCDVVLLEDYAKGFLSKSLASEIFRRARAAGKIVTVDPHPKSPLGNYRGAHVLTPNTKEAEALTGILIRDETTLCQAGQAMIRATGAKHVVITRGKEGMAIFTKGSARVTSIPTYAREVYDVSGAGDTVIAVLSLALSAGASIDEAAVLGNLAAGVEVGKRGTATVSPQEIRVAMEFFGTMGV